MKYFSLTLKKLSTSLPLIIITLIVCAFVASVFLNAFLSKNEEVLPIGLVSESEDAYVDIAATLLSESESFEIIKLEKEEAERLLINKEIQGYAYLPQDFIKEARKGKNIPFTYTVLKKPSAFSEVLTSEVVDTVSVILTESQNSIYGMRQFLKDNGQKALLSDKTNEMSAKLVLNILNRKDLFKNEEKGVGNSLSSTDYYICAFTLIFSLIIGLMLSPKLIKTNMSLSTLLALQNTSPLKQILAEWLSVFLMLWAFSSAFILFVFVNFSFIFSVIPSLLLVSAFLIFLWELSDSLVGGILLTFFTTLISAFLSGLFYPSYLLPDIITKAADFLPIGTAFNYTQKAFSGFPVNTSLLEVCISLFILTLFTLLVRKRRLERGNI